MTNKTIAVAGVLSFGLFALHVTGGGQSALVPALESDASDLVKAFIAVSFHGVTVNLIICSFMLMMAARSETHRTVLTSLVIADYLAFAGLFLFYGITRLGTVFLMIPWTIFLLIAVVSAIGLFRTRGSRNVYAQA
ncbi:MAG: hypothetical protein JJ894_04495 [Dinoroseobacter sp.]|nr:hypothetical protein [Dinoroseobacter sp.]